MEREIYKVTSPIDRGKGKTAWLRVGTAYKNVDGSTNVYLDAYPANGKLQLRKLDEAQKKLFAQGGDK